MAIINSIHNCIQLKDILPLIGTILAVSIGYYGISVQIRKNKRSKWIDDFRRETANFTSALPVFDNLNHDEEKKIIHSIIMLRLYLNRADKRHQNLYKEMDESMSLLLNREIANKLKVDSLRSKFVNILNLATEIMEIEQSKI